MENLRSKIAEELVKEKDFRAFLNREKDFMYYFRRYHSIQIGDYFVWSYRLDFIKEVEEIRHQVLIRRKKIIDTEWKRIYDEGMKFGNIFGYTEDKKVFHIGFYEEGSISPNTIYSLKETELPMFQIMGDEDLPLYMNREDLPKEIQKYIKKRYTREEKKWEFRQDLLDAYEKMEIKFRRISKALGICNSLIQKYVRNKYTPHGVLPDQRVKLLNLTINGRQYMFALSNELEWLITPETEILQESL